MRKLGRRLQRSFFDREVDMVAQDLLGRVIAVDLAGLRVAVRLTEVEAYAGLEDPASHAFRGRTARTAIMFGPAGHLYTYFVYGMHWCANIVTGPEGQPSAVLLRAGEVVAGVDTARLRRPRVARDHELARGPAGLATVLGFDASSNGTDLCRPDGDIGLLTGEPPPASAVRVGPRVGVAAAAELQRRFWIHGDPSVSTFRAWTPRKRPSGPAEVLRKSSRGRWKDDGVPNTEVEPPEDEGPAFLAEPGAAADPLPPLLADLTDRGLISLSTGLAALAADLSAGPLTAYVGFDPTAASLHIGNLVQLLTMRRIQQAGHRPLMLVGGATGLIGDPRMSGERVLNSPEIVAGWVARIRTQVEHYVDFDGPFAARMVNNLDWTAELSTIGFLRDVGKHFRMGRMLAKETVSARLNSDEGLSFTEFSYQILQGMDYLELYRRYGCTLQTGGSDQWGNLTSGTELIRKVEGRAVHAVATPLITKADGTKFGKSEGGAVWLDPEMTSPYAFYQFWFNTDDRDIGGYLKVFSMRPLDEIAELAESTAQRPQAREGQRALAGELTALVHGAAARDGVVQASGALFGRGELAGIDEGILQAALSEAGLTELPAGLTVVQLLKETGLASSLSEGRRAVAEGGANINNVRISDPDHVPASGDLLHGKYLVLRRGKRAVAGVLVDR